MLSENETSSTFTGDAERELAKHNVSKQNKLVQIDSDDDDAHCDDTLPSELLAVYDQLVQVRPVSCRSSCNV